jgi:alpha-tubulin suppressor-like RCC1 family protein
MSGSYVHSQFIFDNQVYGCGGNAYIGVNNTDYKLSDYPVLVTEGIMKNKNIIQVSTGASFTLALSDTGNYLNLFIKII